MNPTMSRMFRIFFFGGGGGWPGVLWGTEGYLGLLDKSRIQRGQGRGNSGTQGRKERIPPPSHPNSLPLPTPAMQAKAE